MVFSRWGAAEVFPDYFPVLAQADPLHTHGEALYLRFLLVVFASAVHYEFFNWYNKIMLKLA